MNRPLIAWGVCVAQSEQHSAASPLALLSRTSTASLHQRSSSRSSAAAEPDFQPTWKPVGEHPVPRRRLTSARPNKDGSLPRGSSLSEADSVSAEAAKASSGGPRETAASLKSALLKHAGSDQVVPAAQVGICALILLKKCSRLVCRL